MSIALAEALRLAPRATRAASRSIWSWGVFLGMARYAVSPADSGLNDGDGRGVGAIAISEPPDPVDLLAGAAGRGVRPPGVVPPVAPLLEDDDRGELVALRLVAGDAVGVVERDPRFAAAPGD